MSSGAPVSPHSTAVISLRRARQELRRPGGAAAPGPPLGPVAPGPASHGVFAVGGGGGGGDAPPSGPARSPRPAQAAISRRTDLRARLAAGPTMPTTRPRTGPGRPARPAAQGTSPFPLAQRGLCNEPVTPGGQRRGAGDDADRGSAPAPSAQQVGRRVGPRPFRRRLPPPWAGPVPTLAPPCRLAGNCPATRPHHHKAWPFRRRVVHGRLGFARARSATRLSPWRRLSGAWPGSSWAGSSLAPLILAPARVLAAVRALGAQQRAPAPSGSALFVEGCGTRRSRPSPLWGRSLPSAA